MLKRICLCQDVQLGIFFEISIPALNNKFAISQQDLVVNSCLLFWFIFEDPETGLQRATKENHSLKSQNNSDCVCKMAT